MNSNRPNEVLSTKITGTLTPLHIACCNGRRSTLKLLINYGADIKVKNNNGEIPFFFFSLVNIHRFTGQQKC